MVVHDGDPSWTAKRLMKELKMFSNNKKINKPIIGSLVFILVIAFLLIVNKWLEFHARGLQANDLIGGALLVIFGVVVLIFGDKKLNVKSGTVLKMVSPRNYPVGLIKWTIGLLSILAGLSFIRNYF
jgi:hypothetical protein